MVRASPLLLAAAAGASRRRGVRPGAPAGARRGGVSWSTALTRAVTPVSCKLLPQELELGAARQAPSFCRSNET